MSENKDESVGLPASDSETADQLSATEENLFAFPTGRWQRFLRTVGPVLEGAAIAVASTVVSATLTVALGTGVIFYTFTALVLISIYFRYRI